VRARRTAYYDELVLPASPAGEAARFFVLHLPQAGEQLRSWLGAESVDFLLALGALASVEGRYLSIVSATWFDGCLIFTDARSYNAIWEDEPFVDYVMPPGGDSVGLMRVAPRGRKRSTLDICCGAGTQTLAAAAYSDRVVGVDLNPRALRFANFNAALNRIDNATFFLGDTYDPLDDAMFDAILANPPFVPWPLDDTQLLYRGGGARGDDVIARILAGAIERLEPHGTLAIVADFANAATLPERIAAWQGEARRTLIVLQHTVSLLDYAETHAGHHPDPIDREIQTVRLLRHFADSNIETLDFGYIIQDGSLGPTHIMRTNAALNGPIHADVADWFASQQRLLVPEAAGDRLELAPGLRLVDLADRKSDGHVVTSCYVAPGPSSVQESSPVNRTAFALLIRAAAGSLRPRDVEGDDAIRELVWLLDRGLLRLRAAQ